MSRILSSVLLVAPLVGCNPAVRTPQPAAQQVRTIENTPIDGIPIEQPPTTEPVQTTTASATTAAAGNEKGRDEGPGMKTGLPPINPKTLPFSPPIAMDPVDGAKIAITPSTPYVEYKGKYYYFGTRENERAFVADPEKYLHGQLVHF
ncbi:MAG: YHS domain-containing protein [Thermoanaerobaculia bacterium]